MPVCALPEVLNSTLTSEVPRPCLLEMNPTRTCQAIWRMMVHRMPPPLVSHHDNQVGMPQISTKTPYNNSRCRRSQGPTANTERRLGPPPSSQKASRLRISGEDCKHVAACLCYLRVQRSRKRLKRPPGHVERRPKRGAAGEDRDHACWSSRLLGRTGRQVWVIQGVLVAGGSSVRQLSPVLGIGDSGCTEPNEDHRLQVSAAGLVRGRELSAGRSLEPVFRRRSGRRPRMVGGRSVLSRACCCRP